MKMKPIALSPGERKELEGFTRKGIHSVMLVRRARVILALDTSGGRTAERPSRIAGRLGISRQAVYDAWGDFLESRAAGPVPQRKKRATPPVEPKITGEVEARIVALACGEAPPGYARWTLQLLADKCVELRYLGAVSHMSISRVLKKRSSSRT
jgi:hypothetical protein